MSAFGEDEVLVDVDAWQGDACVGTVVDVGARARVLVGRRVLVGTSDPCGECDVCRRGGAPVCSHAKPRVTGKQTTAAARYVVPFGDGLELPLPAAAAVPGDVALAYTIYARTGLGPHDAVVVVGASAVTRFLVEILIAKGITPVVIADAPAWTSWLLAKGAIVVPAGGELRARVHGAIAAKQGAVGRPWRVLATDDVDVVALAGPRTTLTLVGPVKSLDPALVMNEVTVIGVAREHPDLIVEAAAMCVKGEVDLAAGTTTERGDSTRSYVALA